MENHFEFYQLPISFQPDPALLKKQFYRKSREFHPDFFVQAAQEAQEKALALSSLNNEAYKTLSDSDRCLKYVLELKGILEAGEKYQLPPSFLMEMMDINEQLMDLQFEADSAKLTELAKEITQIESTLEETVAKILVDYVDLPNQAEDLKKVKEFYFKRRYLLRIRESLDNLALS